MWYFKGNRNPKVKNSEDTMYFEVSLFKNEKRIIRQKTIYPKSVLGTLLTPFL